MTTLLSFGLSYQFKADRLDSLSQSLLEKMNDNIVVLTTHFLLPAMHLAQSSAILAEEGAIDVSHSQQMETYFYGLIKPYPQVQSLYYGDKGGNFYMIKKKEDTSLLTKLVYRTKDAPISILKHRDLFGTISKVEKSKKLNYDPRTRPWFVGAQDSGQSFWTDIYIFFTGQVPGITASYPSYDSNNNFRGVFGVDIELNQISTRINKEKLSEDTLVLIINSKNKVVSNSDQQISHGGLESDLHPLHISEINNELIKKAYAQYASFPEELFTIRDNFQKYIVSIKDFPEDFSKDWRLVLIVPQKDILTETFSPGFNLFLIGLSLIAWVWGVLWYTKHKLFYTEL